MGDSIMYAPDIDMYMNVIKAFLYKLKKHGMLLTINKINTFHKEVKYMGLRMLSCNGRPTIAPLESRAKLLPPF